MLQAVALAEGLDPQAAPKHAQVLRRNKAIEQQIAVNLTKVLAGKEEDIYLQPNDILYIPNNTMKMISTRTIEAAVQIGTGIAVFRQ